MNAPHIFSFEKLDVYKSARELAKEIYTLTANYPNEEKFGLTNQIRRASVSVCLNIAEGSSRFSGKEQARFYEIAYGSLMEVISCLHLSIDLGFLQDTIQPLMTKIQEMSFKINGLRKNALNKLNA